MNDDQPENSSPNPVERPGLESAMRGELYHILRDRSFLKSPTLSKLLAYLVFETINGNGEKLKSYTVAVDCLGKSPDFDAKSDSYPRVQTMRLRKLLEAFYSKNLPSDGLCLYMVAGSYKVRVGPPETAIPNCSVRYPPIAQRHIQSWTTRRGNPNQHRNLLNHLTTLNPKSG